MSKGRKRHPLNVRGDFYVQEGCCTLCGVPAVTAPHLFGGFNSDGTVSPVVNHCWVKQQPRSQPDVEAMLQTIATQELGCIRYGGSSVAIVARLREMGEGDQVDQ